MPASTSWQEASADVDAHLVTRPEQAAVEVAEVVGFAHAENAHWSRHTPRAGAAGRPLRRRMRAFQPSRASCEVSQCCSPPPLSPAGPPRLEDAGKRRRRHGAGHAGQSARDTGDRGPASVPNVAAAYPPRRRRAPGSTRSPPARSAARPAPGNRSLRHGPQREPLRRLLPVRLRQLAGAHRDPRRPAALGAQLLRDRRAQRRPLLHESSRRTRRARRDRPTPSPRSSATSTPPAWTRRHRDASLATLQRELQAHRRRSRTRRRSRPRSRAAARERRRARSSASARSRTSRTRRR